MLFSHECNLEKRFRWDTRPCFTHACSVCVWGIFAFFFTYHVNVLAVFFFISFNADKDVRASNHLKTLMTERSVACGLTHAPWELCYLLLVFPVDLYHRMRAQMLKKMVRCISNYPYTLDYNDDINL